MATQTLQRRRDALGVPVTFERSVAVDEVARSQHGLITTEQAVQALGLSRKNRWVREKRLVSVQPSVFRMAGAPETWHQSVLAACLAVDGIGSHRTAAEMWGLIQPAGYVEVSIPGDARRRVRPPVVLHHIKDLRPGLAVERAGIRITDPVRTVIDLGLVMPWWLVHRAIAKGISTKALTIGEVRTLRDALGRPGRNGTGIVRAILDGQLLQLGKEESELEKRFTALAKKSALPTLMLQHEVWAAGRFVGRVDAAIPDLKLAIEVDGFEHHSTPEAFQHDRSRQNHLVGLGWTVLRFTWHDVVHRPAHVARTIEQAINRLSAA
jgi:very-short-patch-repair endonuclease